MHRQLDRKRLQLLLTAAVQAGKTFASQIEGEKQVAAKTSLADVVTQVDKACEVLIRDLIAKICPADAVLGEEGTAPGAAAARDAIHEVADEDHLWIVDPLDGTTNFVQQIPMSVVSLAYAEQGTLVLGVVYDPYRDELFYAARGFGAYLAGSCDIDNLLRTPLQGASGQAAGVEEAGTEETGSTMLPGRRIAASKTTGLSRSVLASGFPTRAQNREQSLNLGMELVRQVKSLRAFGAAALHLAYVAAGRIDGFWEYDLNAWDIAAGALLVEEAGGCAFDLSGGSFNLRVRDIVACGQSALAETIVNTLRV